MALTSYNDLKAAIATELHRSDITTPIEDFIRRGELRIQREVKAPEMEATYSGTIASGVIAVPTDFLAWRAVYIDSNGANILEPKTWEWVLKNYPYRSASGVPKFIARNATNFEFGPYPDSTYSVKGTYRKRLTTVSSSWNALATANPDLYLYAALTQASAFARDNDEALKWEQFYSAIRDAINSEALGIDFSDMPLRVVGR